MGGGGLKKEIVDDGDVGRSPTVSLLEHNR